jgi:TusA-related sulfurtransferase
MSSWDYSKCPETDKTRPLRLDLRGVPCPLSWAKAKVRLEDLPAGALIEVLLDDPKGARDLPRAAEAEGYDVTDIERRPHDWRIVIAK